MDIRKTLDEREKSYGSFQDNAAIAQSMKDEVALGKAWELMANSAREAIHQILSKISRLVTGDPEHVDGWRDIAGYATLEADRLVDAINLARKGGQVELDRLLGGAEPIGKGCMDAVEIDSKSVNVTVPYRNPAATRTVIILPEKAELPGEGRLWIGGVEYVRRDSIGACSTRVPCPRCGTPGYVRSEHPLCKECGKEIKEGEVYNTKPLATDEALVREIDLGMERAKERGDFRSFHEYQKRKKEIEGGCPKGKPPCPIDPVEEAIDKILERVELLRDVFTSRETKKEDLYKAVRSLIRVYNDWEEAVENQEEVEG